MHLNFKGYSFIWVKREKSKPNKLGHNHSNFPNTEYCLYYFQKNPHLEKTMRHIQRVRTQRIEFPIMSFLCFLLKSIPDYLDSTKKIGTQYLRAQSSQRSQVSNIALF
ncbi:hypothetical protein V6Z11_D10G185300 [Gossypium hirsutum]